MKQQRLLLKEIVGDSEKNSKVYLVQLLKDSLIDPINVVSGNQIE